MKYCQRFPVASLATGNWIATGHAQDTRVGRIDKFQLYGAFAPPRCINCNVTNDTPELNCLLTELASFITKYYPAYFPRSRFAPLRQKN